MTAWYNLPLSSSCPRCQQRLGQMQPRRSIAGFHLQRRSKTGHGVLVFGLPLLHDAEVVRPFHHRRREALRPAVKRLGVLELAVRLQQHRQLAVFRGILRRSLDQLVGGADPLADAFVEFSRVELRHRVVVRLRRRGRRRTGGEQNRQQDQENATRNPHSRTLFSRTGAGRASGTQRGELLRRWDDQGAGWEDPCVERTDPFEDLRAGRSRPCFDTIGGSGNAMSITPQSITVSVAPPQNSTYRRPCAWGR